MRDRVGEGKKGWLASGKPGATLATPLSWAGGRSWVLGSLPLTLALPCPSFQVSAGSPHPAVARLTVRAPPSGSSRFLSIERPDPRPPRVEDTLNLNLRAVGVSGDSFSHYYYMVRLDRLSSRAGCRDCLRREGALGMEGMVLGLGMCSKEETILAPDPVPGPDCVYESGAQEGPDLGLRVCGPSVGTLLLLCGLLLSWGHSSGQLPAGRHPGRGL